MKRIILLMIICSSAAGSLFALANREDNKSWDYKGFTAVENSCSVDVEIRTGKSFSIDVKGDPDYIEDLVIELSGKTLEISYDQGWFFGSSNSNGTTVYISMPEIEALSLTGSGDMKVLGAVQGDEFEIELKGSGSADLEEIDSDKVSFSSLGSGDMSAKSIKSEDTVLLLSGSGGLKVSEEIIASEIQIDIKGSGDVKAGSVKTDSSEISILGSGSVDFDSIDTRDLKIRMTGSGDIMIDSGSVGNLEYDSLASGSLEMKTVKAGKASLNLVGSGDAELGVTDNAEVWLSTLGSGDIYIYGRPDIQKQSSLGSGDIEIK